MRLTWFALLGVVVVSAEAGAVAAAGFDQAHDAWTRVLRTHVNEGRVAYTALRGSEGEKALDAYLRTLGAVTPAQYGTFGQRDKLAFWINAYNAHCVKALLGRMPLRTVEGTPLAPGEARRLRVALRADGSEDLSLSDIEQRILPRFREPRAWLALTCGARGFPPLRGTAFRGDALDSQLDDAAQRFVSDPARNRVDMSSRTLKLSSVFRWHQKELEAAAGSLSAFVAPYLDGDTYEWLRKQGPSVRVAFEPFAWEPNGY